MKEKSPIGKKIFQRMVELGKDRRWLASRMQTSPGRISQLMTQNGYHPPTLSKMAKALRVRPSYFFEGDQTT